jgi:DNA-binding response OmpR family regulator
MDGFEIARQIRADARRAGVCLIALTGYGQAADRAASSSAGFDVHLVKPVHADDLLALLRGGIRRSDSTGGLDMAPRPPDVRAAAGVAVAAAATPGGLDMAPRPPNVRAAPA